MNQLNKKNSILKHLCKTYNINIADENDDEVYLACPKPTSIIEKTLKKLTDKKIVWLENEDTDNNIFLDNGEKYSDSALEKIVVSLINTAIGLNASKIRLEPGTKDYRWRLYYNRGWKTIQYLPIHLGQQICGLFLKKNNIESLFVPFNSVIKLKDWQLKCIIQPVWGGTVVQLEVVGNQVDSINLFDHVGKDNFSNLIVINQRKNRHKNSLAQQIEELSKNNDTVTIGEKIGLNELATELPDEAEALANLISSKPDLVIINHHDVVKVVDLIKILSSRNIKTIINLTAYSPWPLLKYLSEHKINSDAVFISMSGEKVCHQCKQQIASDIKINEHNRSGLPQWLNSDVYENQTCDLQHEDEDFYVVIKDWSGDVDEVNKKLADHIDQLILGGVLTWKNKESNRQIQNNSYFNF